MNPDLKAASENCSAKGKDDYRLYSTDMIISLDLFNMMDYSNFNYSNF